MTNEEELNLERDLGELMNELKEDLLYHDGWLLACDLSKLDELAKLSGKVADLRALRDD